MSPPITRTRGRKSSHNNNNNISSSTSDNDANISSSSTTSSAGNPSLMIPSPDSLINTITKSSSSTTTTESPLQEPFMQFLQYYWSGEYAVSNLVSHHDVEYMPMRELIRWYHGAMDGDLDTNTATSTTSTTTTVNHETSSKFLTPLENLHLMLSENQQSGSSQQQQQDMPHTSTLSSQKYKVPFYYNANNAENAASASGDSPSQSLHTHQNRLAELRHLAAHLRKQGDLIQNDGLHSLRKVLARIESGKRHQGGEEQMDATTDASSSSSLFDSIDHMQPNHVYQLLMQQYQRTKHLINLKSQLKHDISQLKQRNEHKDKELKTMRAELKKLVKLRKKFLTSAARTTAKEASLDIKLLPVLQDEHTHRLKQQQHQLITPLFILCEHLINFMQFFVKEEGFMKVEICGMTPNEVEHLTNSTTGNLEISDQDGTMQDEEKPNNTMSDGQHTAKVANTLKPMSQHLEVSFYSAQDENHSNPTHQIKLYYFYHIHVLTLWCSSDELQQSIADWWDPSDRGTHFPHSMHGFSSSSQIYSDFPSTEYGRPYRFLQDLGDISTRQLLLAPQQQIIEDDAAMTDSVVTARASVQKDRFPSFIEFMAHVAQQVGVDLVSGLDGRMENTLQTSTEDAMEDE